MGNQAEKEKSVSIDRRTGIWALALVLPIPFVAVATVTAGMLLTAAARIVLFLILLNGMLYFYMNGPTLAEKVRSRKAPVVTGYLVSIALCLAGLFCDVQNLWMFGPLLVAALVDTSLGLLYNVICVFLLTSLTGGGMDQILYRFILCAILVVLARFLTSRKNYVYVCVIALSCNVTLLLVLYGFIYRETLNPDSALELASTFLVLTVVWFACRRFVKAEDDAQIAEMAGMAADRVLADIVENETAATELAAAESSAAEITAATESTAAESTAAESGQAVFAADMEVSAEKQISMAEPVSVAQDKQAQADLQDSQSSGMSETDREKLSEILADDYELLARLKQEQPELYRHSMRIGELSYLAAKMIDADAELAKAGGYYHEIGRLISSNYVKEGIRLAKEYDFPKPVIDIIKQYHIKVGVPKTPEAALVMMSENLLSMYEYMLANQEAGKQVSADRFVAKIFDERLLKGSLDQSGITLAQYKLLKQFYTNAIHTETEGQVTEK